MHAFYDLPTFGLLSGAYAQQGKATRKHPRASPLQAYVTVPPEGHVNDIIPKILALYPLIQMKRGVVSVRCPFPARVSAITGLCVIWCSSASHHQLCTGFMDTAKQEIFLIPLVEMFLLALRRFLPEGFSKFSKLMKL